MLNGLLTSLSLLCHLLALPGGPAAPVQQPWPQPRQTPEPWPTPAIYFDPPAWEQETRLYVRNDQAYDLTLELDFERLVNLAAEPALPLTVTAKARATTLVTRLRVLDPGQAFDVYVNVLRSRLGPQTVRHDDSQVYRLPYERGVAHKVLQGYAGSFSHKPPLLQYALDFDLAEGSKILAARAGTVARVLDGYQGFGTHPDFMLVTNLVYVQHADGTFGRYLHLQHKGARVKEGQRVKAGELLALSGNTGYSLAPHLHFDVFKALDESTIETIPVRFQTREAGQARLLEGKRYSSP